MRTWPALAIDIAGADLDRLQVALLDYDVAAIEEQADAVRVFFHTAPERDRAQTGIRATLPRLPVVMLDVPDEDWAARSQADLRAIRVGRVVVTPPWDPAANDSSGTEVTVVIEPSTGFGTGHHATTRLCLAALQDLRLQGRSVIDVGTGSGVLALAASCLGAAPVLGIDADADALESAERNRALNPHARAEFRLADLLTVTVQPVDVVVANLTGALLAQQALRLRALADPNSGQLILSGLLESEEGDVLRAFHGLPVESRTQEDEWVCVRLRTRPSG